MTDLLGFSPFTIGALTDVITGGAGNDPTPPIGIYRSGPKIEQFFMDCGVMMAVGASSRVPATMQTLREIAARPDALVAFKKIIEKVCDPRAYLAEPEKAAKVREHLNIVLEADGYSVVINGGKAQVVARQTSGIVVESFLDKIAIIDFDTVQIEIARALSNVSNDPEDSLTAACSLIESVCRSILIELSIPLPDRKDIEGLMKAVQAPLSLSPGRSDLPPEIESDVRQVLSGITSVIKGVGALRTHGGDAHGRQKGFPRIDARIARLAINSASTQALFLIETWDKVQRRSLPQHRIG